LQQEGKIRVALSAEQMPALFSLLQQGIPVQVNVGVSLEQLLDELFRMPRAYIDDRIQTILLDGKPVDDLGVSIHDNSVIALSAAMPGLVGTTLRRGGHLAAFRKGIAFQDRPGASETHLGRVTVKVFNTLIKELGLRMLENGVCVADGDVRDMLAGLRDRLGLSRIFVDSDGETGHLDGCLADRLPPPDNGDRFWFLQILQKAEQPQQ